MPKLCLLVDTPLKRLSSNLSQWCVEKNKIKVRNFGRPTRRSHVHKKSYLRWVLQGDTHRQKAQQSYILPSGGIKRTITKNIVQNKKHVFKVSLVNWRQTAVLIKHCQKVVWQLQQKQVQEHKQIESGTKKLCNDFAVLRLRIMYYQIDHLTLKKNLWTPRPSLTKRRRPANCQRVTNAKTHATTPGQKRKHISKTKIKTQLKTSTEQHCVGRHVPRSPQGKKQQQVKDQVILQRFHAHISTQKPLQQQQKRYTTREQVK